MNNLLEIKGFLESINRRADFERFRVIISNKIQEEKKKIEKKLLGKKKIIQYFNKKSNEHYINQSEKEIKEHEQMISTIDTILNISEAMILKQAIPEYKSNKFATFQLIVDISSERTEKEIQTIISYLKDLEARI